MAKEFPELDDRLTGFIQSQHIFFTATAAVGTRVNVSPRSTDLFRVLGPGRVAYLDRTGSGNETAAHLKADGRMTIMFCAVAGPPMILRLYGTGHVLHREGTAYAEILVDQFGGEAPMDARQIVVLDVDLVKTSCGYGVPFMEYKAERPSMDNWAAKKGPEGLAAFQEDNNRLSMDGLPTGFFDPA